jgi:hypothetical protein
LAISPREAIISGSRKNKNSSYEIAPKAYPLRGISQDRQKQKQGTNISVAFFFYFQNAET